MKSDALAIVHNVVEELSEPSRVLDIKHLGDGLDVIDEHDESSKLGARVQRTMFGEVRRRIIATVEHHTSFSDQPLQIHGNRLCSLKIISGTTVDMIEAVKFS